MSSRISYNIHAQRLHNHDYLLAHLQKIQPHAVLVMDGLGLAKEIKQLLPDTIVISRIYPDDDIHYRVSPEDWLNARAADAEGGIFQYTTNEAGFGQELIDWHVRLMELAAPRGIPLVVGNMSVGTPQAEEWQHGRRMLELLDQHRDLFILGLHEYACAVITSGFMGGYPDNAGVAPNSGLKGRDLIAAQNWPGRDEAEPMTMFHCGRFKFLTNYCEGIGLNPPRIILTEHGFDDVSDIKPWSDTLDKTGSFMTIRGWKSAQDQWRNWYSPQGWSPDRSLFEQLAYADQTIYQGSPVEAQLIFSWGHSSDMWDQFDVADTKELHQLLEVYAHKPINHITSSSPKEQVGSPLPKQPIMTGMPVMPVGVQPGINAKPNQVGMVQPIGGQSIGEGLGVNAVPDDSENVQPIGVEPGVNAKQGAAVHLEDKLASEDISTILIGLRAAANTDLFSASINADLNRIAAILEQYKADHQ